MKNFIFQSFSGDKEGKTVDVENVMKKIKTKVILLSY